MCDKFKLKLFVGQCLNGSSSPAISQETWKNL